MHGIPISPTMILKTGIGILTHTVTLSKLHSPMLYRIAKGDLAFDGIITVMRTISAFASPIIAYTKRCIKPDIT